MGISATASTPGGRTGPGFGGRASRSAIIADAPAAELRRPGAERWSRRCTVSPRRSARPPRPTVGLGERVLGEGPPATLVLECSASVRARSRATANSRLVVAVTSTRRSDPRHVRGAPGRRVLGGHGIQSALAAVGLLRRDPGDGRGARSSAVRDVLRGSLAGFPELQAAQGLSTSPAEESLAAGLGSLQAVAGSRVHQGGVRPAR